MNIFTKTNEQQTIFCYHGDDCLFTSSLAITSDIKYEEARPCECNTNTDLTKQRGTTELKSNEALSFNKLKEVGFQRDRQVISVPE